MNLKFMGYVRTVKAAIPHMKARGWGRIINVIGNDGTKPIYFEVTPGAANAAGINFTLAIAEELGPYGITVNAINPGPVTLNAGGVWCEALPRGRASPRMKPRPGR